MVLNAAFQFFESFRHCPVVVGFSRRCSKHRTDYSGDFFKKKQQIDFR